MTDLSIDFRIMLRQSEDLYCLYREQLLSSYLVELDYAVEDFIYMEYQ